MGAIPFADIGGGDFENLPKAFAFFGVPGVIGAAMGVGVGALLSNYSEERGWGNPSAEWGPFYWLLCGAVGAVLLAIFVGAPLTQT